MPLILGVETLEITSASPGPLSVTVPSGTQGVVIGFRTLFDAFTVSSSFAGTFEELPQTDGNAVQLHVAPVTATGSQTITPAFGSYMVSGPVFFLAYIGGIDNSSIAAWVRDGGTDADATSLSASSTEEDLVLGFDNWSSTTNTPPPNETGWTSLITQGYNEVSARIRTADSPGASTTTINAQSGFSNEFPALGIVSLIGSGGGGGPVIPVFAHHMRQQGIQ